MKQQMTIIVDVPINGTDKKEPLIVVGNFEPMLMFNDKRPTFNTPFVKIWFNLDNIKRWTGEFISLHSYRKMHITNYALADYVVGRGCS